MALFHSTICIVFIQHTSSSFSILLEELRQNNYWCGAERIKADPGVWVKVITDPDKDSSSRHHVAGQWRSQDLLHSYSNYKDESLNLPLRPCVCVWVSERVSIRHQKEMTVLASQSRTCWVQEEEFQKDRVPILIIDGTRSVFLGTGQAWKSYRNGTSNFYRSFTLDKTLNSMGATSFPGASPQISSEACWPRGQHRACPGAGVPSGRPGAGSGCCPAGTCGGHGDRKWVASQALSSQLSGCLGPGSNNVHEGQPGTLWWQWTSHPQTHLLHFSLFLPLLLYWSGED